MPIHLGPLPRRLQDAIKRWIEEGRKADPPTAGPDVDALLIHGELFVYYHLKTSGEILCWDDWDNLVTIVKDGPEKVRLIVVAAQQRPELAAWLPIRHPSDEDCGRCDGGGWLLPPWPRVACPDCSGLGWVSS